MGNSTKCQLLCYVSYQYYKHTVKWRSCENVVYRMPLVSSIMMQKLEFLSIKTWAQWEFICGNVTSVTVEVPTYKIALFIHMLSYLTREISTFRASILLENLYQMHILLWIDFPYLFGILCTWWGSVFLLRLGKVTEAISIKTCTWHKFHWSGW